MKYFLYSILTAIILSAGYLLVINSRPVKKAKIFNEIDKANYCITDADCEMVESKCPFDCFVVVNNKEAERISDLISGYKSNCVYGCAEFKGSKCLQGKCGIIR